MAEIVLGLGTSHSPQLSTSAEIWELQADRDRHNHELIAPDGNFYTYDQLVEMAPPDMHKELTSEKWRERDEANQRGIAKVGEVLAEVSPDLLVIVGDDQEELFLPDNMPSILVYWGDSVLNHPEFYGRGAPPGIKAAAWGFGGDRPMESYPVHSSLAKHIIEYLIDQEFDVGRSSVIPEGKGMSHAFGFIYRRIMGDKKIPTVPVFINTYYPPNQPTPNRCYELGRKIREAVESWSDSNTRVGIIASGGLSHFVVDEELDRMALKAMEEQDVAGLVNLPRHRLNSGNSEIRNWIAVAGASEHLRMETIDYVPCYRSPAGTGCGMGFASWR